MKKKLCSLLLALVLVLSLLPVLPAAADSYHKMFDEKATPME